MSSLRTPPRLFGRRRPLGRRGWACLVVLVLAAIAYDCLGASTAVSAEKADTAKTTTEHSDGHTDDHGDSHAKGANADGHGGGGGHADPTAPVMIAIVLILLAAKLFGDVFERIGMPAVLGELTVGVLLGNCAYLTGWKGLDFLQAPPDIYVALATDTGAILKILAGIGVVLLLFEVGLESSVREMMSVGTSAMLVAILGVVAPIALGFGVGMLLLPGEMTGGLRTSAAAFIGATLCATSVGITARVLKDLGKNQQKESQIILGAAVVDDVLGLIVLAVVSGVIAAAGGDGGAGDTPLGWKITQTIVLAFGFIAGALLLGALRFQRALFYYASRLHGHGMLVATALVICFGFSWLANQVELATIVGAFAAGLILEGAHYRELGQRENRSLEEAIAPLSALLVPIFFVQMGIQVQLSSFANPSVWLLAGGITVVAIIGKQVCSLGVREPGLNKAAVGLGMIPRGEVGLIFADQGKRLVFGGQPVMDDNIYSAVIVMVMITTMVTPPLLKWSLGGGGEIDEGDSESETGTDSASLTGSPEPSPSHG